MATTETLPEVRAPQASRFRAALRACFSFPVLLATLLLCANFVIQRGFRIEPDTWWHTKYGEMILSTGHWPQVDTWSFTASGTPRVAYEWGGEVLLALVWRAGGLRAFELLMVALTSVILLLIYYFAHLRCRNSKAAFLATSLAVPLAAVCFTLRPQLIGYIFLLIALISLERFRLGLQKSLWILPPLFLVWINMHSSFSLGFMALGLYWASGLGTWSSGGLSAERWSEKQRMHLELVCLLSLLVLPITPYGARLAAVPVDVAASLPVNFANVHEWQPLNLMWWQAKLLLILVLAFLVAQSTLRLTHRVEELALFLVATYSVFVHVRFAILFAIVGAPLIASILARWVPPYKPEIDKYIVNALLIVAATVAMWRYFPAQADLETKVAAENPVQAVEYLRQHPVAQPMFNGYGFGGYLIWSTWPEYKVFIDGRGDFYEQAGVFSDYLSILNLKPETFALLNTYRIQSCLIPAKEPLATLLTANSDWKLVYKDKLSVIFIRVPHSDWVDD